MFYKRKTPKVEIIKENTKEKTKFDKDEIYQKSIIIEGPTGIGKSIVAERLSQTTGLPVISFEALRHCPREIELIYCRQEMLNRYIAELEDKLLHADEISKSWMTIRLSRLKQENNMCDKQLFARQFLPKVPCYENLGYQSNIASIMRAFGYMGSHLYEKQYESRLLRSILASIRVPVILDLTASAPIALADVKADTTAKLLNRPFIKSCIDTQDVYFYPIKKALSPFENIIYLRSPSLAALEEGHFQSIDQVYTQSKQYDHLATTTIDADGLVTQDGPDKVMLDHFCEILTQNWKDKSYQPILPVGNQKLLHE